MWNTAQDVTTAVARLDKHAAMGEKDTVTLDDGSVWTGFDMRLDAAEQLAAQTRGVVRLFKVSKRDVALMMAAHGASTFTVERHARAVAALIRSSIAFHSWTGTV